MRNEVIKSANKKPEHAIKVDFLFQHSKTSNSQISNSWFFLRRNNSIIDQDRSVKMARYQPWFLFSVFMYLNLAFLIYEMKTGDLKDLQSSSVFDNSNIECDGKL